MKKFFLLAISTIALQSCSNDDSTAAVMASNVAISLIDSQGNDLLNENHPNHYPKDSIKIYNMNGHLINYAIGKGKDETPEINAFAYFISQFCNDAEIENRYCKRLWYWNSSEVDTIEIYLKEFDDNLLNTYKYKVNGVEYTLEGSSSNTIQLIK